MALMRTKRNGEDPKKPTWDDVSKNEAIKERNKVAKQKYESDVANYNRAMKAYSEQPKNRDLKSHFQGGGRYLSPSELESWNKEQEASGLAKERGGLKASKVYVNKDYGKEGSSSSLKMDTGKSYSGGLGSFHEWLGKPESVKSPAYEKEESIDVSKLPISKLPLKKPMKVEGRTKKLAVSESTPSEKPDWEEPSGTTRYRTKYSMPDISTTSKAKSLGRFMKAKVESIGKDNALTPGLVKERGKARLIQGKAGREANMAKAYFSGYEGKSKFDIEGTSEERGVIGKLKADKADLKEGIKAVRRGTAAPSITEKSDRIAGLRAAKKDVKSQIKQANLASKYLSKLGQEETGVVEGQTLYRTGKIKTMTPEVMAGFSGSKQDTYDPDAKFKSQLSNAVNNNKTFGRKVKNK
jgi:hypothetical protein